MSIQDNLKLDEEVIAAWNAHDVERSVAVFPDDVKWHDIGSPQPFNGKDGISGSTSRGGSQPSRISRSQSQTV